MNEPAVVTKPETAESSDNEALEIQKKNFRYVQIDAVGVGLASSAAPYLPVFLTQLGASNVQVGLLTTMPGVTGLVLSLFVGRFLQTRRNVVPWFSLARLFVLSCYALTGLMPFLIKSPAFNIYAILAIWAFATLPQTVVNVAFSVVMNAVAGPEGRYQLMSRRWSTLGLTSSIMVFTAGWFLDRIAFPLNFQVVFMILSVGSLVSYYFSSHIMLADREPPEQIRGQQSPRQTLKIYAQLLRSNPPFVSFSIRRFVYLSGISLAAPLFPLYFVREIHASNAWIGIISTAQSFVMLFGYFLWTRLSHLRGSRFVLLWTTGAVAVYPLLISLTHRVELIAFYAALVGLFQAGLDLVFFDELMKTVPVEYSATFVSLAQSIQYMSTIIAPLAGTFLADWIGLGPALIVGTALRLTGFLLFFTGRAAPADEEEESEAVAV